MNTGLKNEILKLRNEGKNYNEIKVALGCSKATISYHCQRHNLGNGVKILTDAEKDAMNIFYKTHSIEETSVFFNVSKTTVVRYVDNKHIKLTDAELKRNNYNHVKTHRQKIKEQAVKYLGGGCQRCGYNKCIRALEFHHTDPTQKDYGISNYGVLSWEKVKIELDKCILVCANCHREIHEEIDNRDVSPLTDTA